MPNDIRLLMLSAMYENGGNTSHRFLDGHPGLCVYPFESQVGTRHVLDHLTSMFPVKYRWPEFLLASTAEADYRAIVDEECKVRARTPQVSKFRHVSFDFSDDERGRIYATIVARTGRSRGGNVAAFFQATFEAWKDHRRAPGASVYVGYSPIVAVDAEKIVSDLPNAHVLHVVRNPWSAYADTKKRPVPLSLDHYMLGWTLNQQLALAARQRHPDRVHVVRAEDVMADPVRTLGAVLDKLGLGPDPALRQTSWNGAPLPEVYPWGTIRTPTPEANHATALELSPDEREEVRVRAEPYLERFDYARFL